MWERIEDENAKINETKQNVFNIKIKTETQKYTKCYYIAGCYYVGYSDVHFSFIY